MQPSHYTGDPEFIDECKEAYVQPEQPQLILLNNLSAHTPADELFMRFFSILKGLSTSTFATQAKYALLRLERQVIDQAVILTAQAELPKETKPKNALKPVEIYSRFSDILRFIGTTSKVYGLDAIQVLRDVYLSQTQTDSELDNRFWVDSMTGQTDPEFAITDVDIPEVHVLSPEGGEQAAVTAMAATEENSARFKKPIEISKWDKWCVQRSGELQAEIGWTDKERWQWVEAQGSAAGSGEIEDEEDPEDDRGYVPPTLVKDLVDVGEKAPLNKGCFAPISFAFYDFNKARKTLFAEMAIKSEMNKAAYDVISKLDKALAAPLKRFDKVNTPYQLSELLKILAIAMFQKDSLVSLPDARQKVLEYIASYKLLHGEEYNLTEGDKVTGNTWKPYFQKHIRQTEAFTKMVNAIQSTADHFGAKEAVAVYLKVAGDYGLLAGANKAHAPAQIKKLIADIVAVKKKNATIATFLGSFKDVNVPEEAFHLIEKYHVALFSKEKPKARKLVLAKAEMQLLEYIFSFYQAEGEEYDASEVYNDISQINLNPHLTIDGITDFEEFLAEYETDISDMLNDGSLGVFPTSERVVDEFVAQTKEMIAHRYPTHDHNALNTASWNLAYQNAITSGASFPDAEAKAWEAWRYAMSFFAAKEYDRVMKVERNRTKAMAAFWRFAPPSVPRPQDKIVSVNKDGLVFKKRNVTWGIAKLKLSKDELEIDNELASRLFGILKEKGWGNGFEKQLALKFSIK